jgi:bifunctional non-homologous end joining protein LigD
VTGVEIVYSTLTENSLLREAVFNASRKNCDLPAMSTPGRRPSPGTTCRAQTGVPRENVLQLLADAVPPSKEELDAYWTKVWKRALPHLGRRPLKLVRHVRCPTFYHIWAGCRRSPRQFTG